MGGAASGIATKKIARPMLMATPSPLTTNRLPSSPVGFFEHETFVKGVWRGERLNDVIVIWCIGRALLFPTASCNPVLPTRHDPNLAFWLFVLVPVPARSPIGTILVRHAFATEHGAEHRAVPAKLPTGVDHAFSRVLLLEARFERVALKS